jgi:hypothetical protein
MSGKHSLFPFLLSSFSPLLPSFQCTLPSSSFRKIKNITELQNTKEIFLLSKPFSSAQGFFV